MAVPFCKMRSELAELLTGLKGEMAALRLVVDRCAPARRATMNDEHAKAAQDLRALDQAYVAFTGVVLKSSDELPRYHGPLYQWRSEPNEVAKKAVQALERLRRGQPGCHPHTANLGRHYFSSIWPTDLEWPADIPRPASNPSKKESA